MRKSHIHIVFDLDGTLTNTQQIHQQLEQEFLASKGIHITPHNIEKNYAGRSPTQRIPELLESNSLAYKQQEIDEFVHYKDQAMIKAISSGRVGLMPGVQELLVYILDQGYICGISTGACREFIETFLDKYKLRDVFIASTSADEVEYKKPHPQVFETTFTKLEMLHSTPTKKIVIGDGLSDAIGGKKAGAYTIRIPRSGLDFSHRQEEIELYVDYEISRIDDCIYTRNSTL